jgi:type II secretory pathway pseudopilin PulG
MMEKGISLLALIITIIVIIILAAIVIGSATETPEKAREAKIVSDYTEIKKAVAVKRTQNQMPNINGIKTDKNAGFTKIKM